MTLLSLASSSSFIVSLFVEVKSDCAKVDLVIQGEVAAFVFVVLGLLVVVVLQLSRCRGAWSLWYRWLFRIGIRAVLAELGLVFGHNEALKVGVGYKIAVLSHTVFDGKSGFGHLLHLELENGGTDELAVAFLFFRAAEGDRMLVLSVAITPFSSVSASDCLHENVKA